MKRRRSPNYSKAWIRISSRSRSRFFLFVVEVSSSKIFRIRIGAEVSFFHIVIASVDALTYIFYQYTWMLESIGVERCSKILDLN